MVKEGRSDTKLFTKWVRERENKITSVKCELNMNSFVNRDEIFLSDFDDVLSISLNWLN